MRSYLTFLRIFLAGIVFAPLVHSAFAQTGEATADTVLVDLVSSVERALEFSPEIGAAGDGRDFAEARLRFANAHRYLAEFEATTAHSTAPGLKNDEGVPRRALYLDSGVRNDWSQLSMFNRIDVEVVQPILTWGELTGNVRAARNGVEVEEQSVRSKTLEVASRTGRIYFGLLLTEALYRLALDAREIVERAISEIEKQIDEGATDVDDADLFQVQIAEQEVLRQVVEVDQKRHTSRAALARQMLLPEGTLPDAGNHLLAPVPFDLLDLGTYQELALASRPEIAQSEAGLAARSALVEVARSDYYPKLFLAASANYSYAPGRYLQRNPYVDDPFLTGGVQAGFGFRQKLNFGQTRAKVEQARSEAARVRHQGEAAVQLVLYEVEEAYRNVIAARSAVDTQAKQLIISKNWLRNEEINFDLDLGDTENLVRAVKANLAIQASSNQAVFDYNVAVLRLLEKTGSLTSEIQGGMFVGQ